MAKRRRPQTKPGFIWPTQPGHAFAPFVKSMRRYDHETDGESVRAVLDELTGHYRHVAKKHQQRLPAVLTFNELLSWTAQLGRQPKPEVAQIAPALLSIARLRDGMADIDRWLLSADDPAVNVKRTGNVGDLVC